jgi:hypothetical protein
MKQPTAVGCAERQLLDETESKRADWRRQMRWIHKSRHQRHRKVPRIAISQAEISADLHYPAGGQAADRIEALASRSRSAR